MNKNIEHYLFHKENFLDEKYCENCINELDKCTWSKHNWYDSSDGSLISKAGDNELEVLFPKMFSFNIEKINDFVIQNLHSLISEYIERLKFDWFYGWDGYSAIRFNRYSLGQTMQKHCDHIHDMFDGEKKGIPVLSIIGILNDDYEGGELSFFGDKKIDIKKGDLLIFPSNFLYPHEVTPVTKGVRYSYVSWAW